MNKKTTGVQRTHDLLSEYSSARHSWAKQAVEDNEFRNGKQWTEEESIPQLSRQKLCSHPINPNFNPQAVRQVTIK